MQQNITAYFSSYHADAIARVTFPSSGPSTGHCTHLVWFLADPGAPGGRGGLVAQWQKGPFPPPGPPCTFKQTVMHDQPLMHQTCPKTGVYSLTSVNKTSFSIHSVNGTFADTVADIVLSAGSTKLLSASFTVDGKARAMEGTQRGCYSFEWRDAGATEVSMRWSQGPPGPPRPPNAPPNATCDGLFNQTACAAALQPCVADPAPNCAWCHSGDGAHTLCFWRDNLPPAAGGWKCTAP